VPLDPHQLAELRREMNELAPRLLRELDQLDALLAQIAAADSA
jgi:hypothetical protein